MNVEVTPNELLPQMTLEEALEFLDTCGSEVDVAFETAAETDIAFPSDYYSLNLNAAFVTSYGSPCASESSDWGANASSCSTTCSDSSETLVVPVTQTPQYVTKKPEKTSKRSVFKSTSAMVEKPQKVRKRKRNKTEILALREEVLHLTARLAQRQKLLSTSLAAEATFKQEQDRSNSLVVAANNVSGVQLADLELQKLEVSKTANRKLKGLLAKQMKLCAIIQKVFEKQIPVKQELELLQIPEQESKLQDEDVSSFLAALYQNLDEFLCTIDGIIASINSRNTAFVFSNCHMYRDPMRGQVAEFIMNAPLATSLYELDKCMWGQVTSVYCAKSPDGRTCTPPMHENTIKFQYTNSVIGDFGQILLNLVSVGRRVVAPHRVVMAFASLLEVAGTGIAFRENCCFIMSDTLEDGPVSLLPHSSSSTSQFQSFYQISAATRDHAADSTDTQALQDFILTTHCDKRKANLLRMLDVMVHQFPQMAADIDRFGSSPLITCGI